MKRLLIVVAALSLALFDCSGQKSKEKQLNNNTPQTKINVKKQYDKNGNVVRYDSTYSSVSSNIKGDSTLRDSIFTNFEKRFNENYFFSNEPYFKNFFFSDSLLRNDFFNKDFFSDRFKNNMAKMDSLFKEMDVFKNDFFNSQKNNHIKDKKN